jgi:hypothetical protein
VHLWFERKISESADPHIDQAERRVINANVATAFGAIPAITDVAAFEFAEEVRAFREVHVLPFPRRERAHRSGGITTAVFAMTVTHFQGFTAHLDLHYSAVTSAGMCGCHDQEINHEESESGKQENRKKSGIRMCWGCLTRSLPLTRLFGLPVDIV